LFLVIKIIKGKKRYKSVFKRFIFAPLNRPGSSAMKRFLAFILILSHMNTSMFLPQVPEQDVYDANGSQLDDITSIVELVRVKLGYDHRADDENDDSGQNFHIVNVSYTIETPANQIKKEFAINNSNNFHDLIESKIPSVCCDILIPPPKV
jgi:hypothetical protein